MSVDILSSLRLILIPEPQQVEPRSGVLRLGGKVCIVPAEDSEEDRFAAEVLAECLKSDFGLAAAVTDEPVDDATPIELKRGPGLRAQGCRLIVTEEEVRIEGADAAGVYYGTQTLRQCLRHDAHGVAAPCLRLTDWPDLKYRAIHYDTKHHADRREWVEGFIRELARYKVNVLIWEWEDKFAYRSRPEVAAPGAFTMKEMQAFTALARRHHIQIVPLVQGLGHVSYILKHAVNKHLREIPNSDWEFCPLRDETYRLLFDLWDEAIEATPGSEFLHVGSDETYELGLGEACGCKAKAAEIGKDGLMQIFIRRAVEHVEKRGRVAMSWGGRWQQDSKHLPPKKMIFVDSGDTDYLLRAKEAGYAGWVYAPNPGIEPLFLPYLPFVRKSMWRDDAGSARQGSFIDTAGSISRAGVAKACEGSLTTSWDDSGLHTCAWMPRFICAAEFSWKADGRDVETWMGRYFAEYFGSAAADMRELFQLMQDGAEFYYDTFQRKVWHWGAVGKIHVPDFPRAAIEFDNFFRIRCASLLNRAREERQRVARALDIIDANLARSARPEHRLKHRCDFEVMRTCAELMRHNADLILMLGELEECVAFASQNHFSNRAESLRLLKRGVSIIEQSLADREKVFAGLVSTWERTCLPKGMSLPGKPYVFARERARHFANRTPDMTFLILDEKLLDLEGYLARLKGYVAQYEKTLDA